MPPRGAQLNPILLLVYPVKIKGHMNFQEQTITIQQVSQRLDVPKPTLRFWEREFEGILVPLRTNGGQRRYAPEHISVIEEIKMLKKAGLSLIQIKRKLEKGIDDSLIGRFDDWEKGIDGGQMLEAGSQTCPQHSRHARHLPANARRWQAGREAQPRRTGLRGGRGSGDGRTEGIDLLADRVAEVVKMEVLKFFESGHR